MKTIHVITRNREPWAARDTYLQALTYIGEQHVQAAIDGADTAAMSPPIWAVVEVPFGAGKLKGKDGR